MTQLYKMYAEVAADCDTTLPTVVDVALRGELTPTGRAIRSRTRAAKALRDRGINVPGGAPQALAVYGSPSAITARGGFTA